MGKQNKLVDAHSLRNRRQKVRALTEVAMLLALTMTLAWFETLLPPPPTPVPLRYGLANIVLLYSLLRGSTKTSFFLLLGKVFFVLILRGPLAASLSLAGSILAFIWLVLALYFWDERISYLLLSAWAAVLHNIGQLVVVSLFFIGPDWFFIYPYLLVTGLGMGALTAGVLYSVQRSLPQKSRI